MSSSSEPAGSAGSEEVDPFTKLLAAVLLPVASVVVVFLLFLLKVLCERDPFDPKKAYVELKDTHDGKFDEQQLRQVQRARAVAATYAGCGCTVYTQHVIAEYLLALVDLQALVKQVALLLMYGGSIDELFWVLFGVSVGHIMIASLPDGLFRAVLSVIGKFAELLVYVVFLQVTQPLLATMLTFFAVDMFATLFVVNVWWQAARVQVDELDPVDNVAAAPEATAAQPPAEPKKKVTAGRVIKVMLWLMLVGMLDLLRLVRWLLLITMRLLAVSLINVFTLLTLYMSPESPFRTLLWYTIVQFTMTYVGSFLANNNSFNQQKTKHLSSSESALPSVYIYLMAFINVGLVFTYFIATIVISAEQLRLPADSMPQYDRIMYAVMAVVFCLLLIGFLLYLLIRFCCKGCCCCWRRNRVILVSHQDSAILTGAVPSESDALLAKSPV